jgi:hypothetical protein
MAYLVCIQDNIRCYLKTHHVFGRLAKSANTVISNPEISKIHTIIEWGNHGWHLTDFSSNGTWINNGKVTKNTATPIKLGDIICFAAKSSNEFVVNDISPPCDLLVPYEKNSPQTAIALKPYNLLPNEEAPEISLFYENAIERWFVEYLIDDEREKELLKHNDIVKFAGTGWQLKVNVKLEDTVQLTPNIESLEELSFVFNVSADEEATQLILQAVDQCIDLKVRSHHYLTLTLARKRIEDIKEGLQEAQQGWFYSDNLGKDLGLEPCHLNIQVHRARKQFSDNINNDHLEQLFERQCGRIRLGSQFITINKGGLTEFAQTR